ncbi:MAG: D-tyrosyl-tRNA(Tyr) deacylase [Gemmatimonadetes bacterium]|nr:D-tyrosyl-tRNA(Tyr) deacylase [Gemmatimonadota bacterium]
MRAVIQRVTRARVTVEDRAVAEIGPGLVILVGIAHDDDQADIDYLAEKTLNMRIFPPEGPEGEHGGFERSALDIGAHILLVSQFTLYATTRKGRRPGFSDAAPADVSGPMFERVAEAFRASCLRVETGLFGAYMLVELENAGPATIILDTADRRTPRRQA